MIGLTIEDVKEEILNLFVEDYYSGPNKDYNENRVGEIWVFKKKLDGIKFYLKLKISNKNNNEILKCISFHEDNI